MSNKQEPVIRSLIIEILRMVKGVKVTLVDGYSVEAEKIVSRDYVVVDVISPLESGHSGKVVRDWYKWRLVVERERQSLEHELETCTLDKVLPPPTIVKIFLQAFNGLLTPGEIYYLLEDAIPEEIKKEAGRQLRRYCEQAI